MDKDPKDTVQWLLGEVAAHLEYAALAALEGQSPWADAAKARAVATSVRAHLEQIDRKLDAAEVIAERHLSD